MEELTIEQQQIKDYIQEYLENEDTSNLLVKVEATAGSGKTFLLRMLTNLFSKNGLYLAYNKAIATEANTKFPNYVECKTTHSLAYYPIMVIGLSQDGVTDVDRRKNGKKALNRKVGFFNYRNIEEDINYDEKIEIVKALEAFYLSKYTNIEEFLKEVDLARKQKLLVIAYFAKMIAGIIECTHSFYLKYYHICLADDVIHYNEYECVMLDEAGDINPVTLEIFKLLPAKLKLMVGDKFQNIYSFNHTINGFKKLENEGVTFRLSQSFRCSPKIAERIERFCINHLDENFSFIGTPPRDTAIRTTGMISRTNSGIIGTIIKMMQSGTRFSTTRSYAEIFSTVLTLINLNKNQPTKTPALKYLNDDLKTYQKSKQLMRTYSTIIKYLDDLYSEYDTDIRIAINTIRIFGVKDIWDAFYYTKQHSTAQHKITLTTAHSSKGLEFDKVVLLNDFNLTDILEMDAEKRDNKDIEELNLYYVACSRAKLQLDNAGYLEQ